MNTAGASVAACRVGLVPPGPSPSITTSCLGPGELVDHAFLMVPNLGGLGCEWDNPATTHRNTNTV